MRALSASELLETWDHGFGQSPTRRALTLLHAACRETTPEQLAKLSIGQRDARLLALRELTFGRQLTSLASCPGCGERLELEALTSDLSARADLESADDLSLVVDRYEIRFRLPTSLDLIAISEAPERNSARASLLARCIYSARFDGSEMDAAGLPPNVIEAIAARMSEADPQADCRLALRCPACDREWQSQFDIASYFWAEINAWTTRILNEVHILASAYGWSEADILGMSARRRQLYLNLVSQ
jgi:hypothetical protein